ncbi:glycosyltransferase [Flavobacterium panici]|uniref:Glycosyltransferase family 4 protein n=1 Tax=Flavobacterium panici TaxID=2654843 RepID=A0A9N8J5H6_9FLAO|nr:glycosyltransferase [Flavobacterium panici]CAC9976387.1 glycosyltransferase family 4 protein [Flavobacterium panici]
MKIIFISMHSIHAVRWIDNLKESEHDFYWYDILGSGKLETLETVKQFLETRKRKIPYLKGEYSFSKKMPGLYKLIRPFLETTEHEALERIIKEINPDVIHSFEMQSCSYPIIKAMNKFPKIKWIYSCWGNDLFYFQNFEDHKSKIKNVLKRVDYLHTDCFRDYEIAKELGFKGKHVGVIPGGTGYKIKEFEIYKLPIEERKIILVKGYQNLFGRGINVIKALEKIKTKIDQYEIIVFGAHNVVEKYVVENNLAYKTYGRHDLSHQQIMELMGKSILYIGNNISDGMANTLLEAIVMGAFPIQSNPGNVSAEIINHGINGFLIKDPENIDSIAELITKAIEDKEMLVEANKLNSKIAFQKLDYNTNQQKVIALYKNLEINY